MVKTIFVTSDHDQPPRCCGQTRRPLYLVAPRGGGSDQNEPRLQPRKRELVAPKRRSTGLAVDVVVRRDSEVIDGLNIGIDAGHDLFGVIDIVESNKQLQRQRVDQPLTSLNKPVVGGL